jgi:hypothetical protein
MIQRERGLFGVYSVDDVVLNKGGVGSIHCTNDPSFVYKRYFSAQKAPRREHLDHLIEVGRDVLIHRGRRPGDTPESSVNWPIDVVVDDSGVVNGVVLPTIPSTLLSAELNTVRTLDFLVMARARPPSAKGRVVLLLRMAEILAFVNARGLVHGDVNSKNLAWTLCPDPLMYLIDCDGMLPQSPPPTTGVGATGWMDPRVVDRVVPAHDHYSDWYGLALAMYRGLLLTPGRLDKTSDGRWPEPSQIPPELHPEVAHLIRRGLSDPLASFQQRPTPKEWVDVLWRTYLPNGSFDEDALTALDTLSASKSIPPTNFVPVPPLEPVLTSPPPLGPRQLIPPPQPTRQPPPQPTRQPPPQPTTQWSPPLPVETLTVPRPYLSSIRGQTGGPTGNLALQAVHAGRFWHASGLLTCIFFPFVALLYIGMALFQLRRASSDYPGVSKARITLVVYAALGLAFFLLHFFP